MAPLNPSASSPTPPAPSPSPPVTNLVFLHGWGVHHTKTYGRLPARLAKECPGLSIHHLHLGRYISFHDEVRMDDAARALEAAVERDLAGISFAVVTHSTGAPLVRTWWRRYYRDRQRACPMTHAIHLAGAQFGSALAQLGKGTLGRIKGFAQGIEPGEGILDWLELGSPEAWALNEHWIREQEGQAIPPPYHFSLTGQCIDRKVYDHLNSYTGEIGSDGVIRVASANLNAGFLRLRQKQPTAYQFKHGHPSLLRPDREGLMLAQPTPFTLVPGASHVGKDMGIMRSVKTTGPTPPVVKLMVQCLAISDDEAYRKLTGTFQQHTARVARREHLEHENRLLLDRTFFRDACSMVIFRVRDEEGRAPDRFRITLTGADRDPDKLPKGFLVDRQKNRRDPGAITFFLNHDVLRGCEALKRGRTEVRTTLPPLAHLGLKVEGFPDEGFAHYHPCETGPSTDLLNALVRPHQTTLVDTVLKRIVRRGTLTLTDSLKHKSFKRTKPGVAMS